MTQETDDLPMFSIIFLVVALTFGVLYKAQDDKNKAAIEKALTHQTERVSLCPVKYELTLMWDGTKQYEPQEVCE